MRLVHVESNFPTLFGPIEFRAGLNVIFARVRDPSAAQRSAHNLGKSFLMEVIDFALGGDVDKNHPFKKRKDLFGDFEFTVQMRTNAGTYISACRPVQGRAACRVHIASRAVAPGRYPEPEGWTRPGLSVADMKETIDGLLNLSDIRPYQFRKGLGYQLRGQLDYSDEFQISKFAGGKDRDWRPYVARILGFDQSIFLSRYDVDDRISSLKKAIGELEGSDQRNKQQYDEVRGKIEIREAEIAEQREQLARFQFTGIERQVNTQLVGAIETAMAELNVRRYSIDRDLRDIEQSLTTALGFDMEQVRKVYREVGVELPDSLVRSFDDLVEFNRRISSDRNQRLQRLRAELVEERATVEGRIDTVDRERQDALGMLKEAESFAKYRALTDHLFGLEAGLRGLRERLAQLGQANLLKGELSAAQKDLIDARAAVAAEVQAPNDFFTKVRHLFDEAVREIVGTRAVLSAGLNSAGNIEFKTSVLDEAVKGRETYEGEGTSYKKLLCACVDLALLQAHATGSYYRFVYHDGVFEGLDNRRKVALLAYVRRATEANAIQYVLTVIDSDLPRDSRDNKLLFADQEVILKLHDAGEDGRLFRMERF